MKKLFTLLFFFSLCAVSFAQIQKGTVQLENGAEEKVSVPYQTINCTLTSQDVENVAFLVGLNAKFACKNRLSYTPRKVEIMQSADTATVFIRFSAKNGYGAEGGLKMICIYKINNLDKERRDLLADYVVVKNLGAYPE